MDLSEPARVLAPGLTVPVLRALSQRTTPATASQIWRAARSGTLAGVQRACDRLVEHGLVEEHDAGGRTAYTLNYDHVLYDTVATALKVDMELRQRLVRAIDRWDLPPVSALLFGSAARRDGDAGSDVDLLLVRPALNASRRPVWGRQVHDLARDVRRWTGNRLEVVDLRVTEVRRMVRGRDPVAKSWLDEGITLHGVDLEEVGA